MGTDLSGTAEEVRAGLERALEAARELCDGVYGASASDRGFDAGGLRLDATQLAGEVEAALAHLSIVARKMEELGLG